MRQPIFTATAVELAFTDMSGQGAEFLGLGAFGETWKVSIEMGNGQRVIAASKFITDAHNREFDYERELNALQLTDHPNLLSLVWHGSRRLLDKEYPTIVSPFIPGGDAAARLKRDGSPLTEDAAHFTLGVATGLHELHSRQYVHRDLKPSNILLRDDTWSAPVIADFGLARSLTEETLTEKGGIWGTAAYMAPELNPSSETPDFMLGDLWSLGAVLHELVAGAPPRKRPGAVDLDDKALGRTSPTLAGLIRRLLDTAPGYRPLSDQCARIATYALERH